MKSTKKDPSNTEVQDHIYGFTAEFFQTFSKEIIIVLLKLLKNYQKGGNLPKLPLCMRPKLF